MNVNRWSNRLLGLRPRSSTDASSFKPAWPAWRYCVVVRMPLTLIGIIGLNYEGIWREVKSQYLNRALSDFLDTHHPGRSLKDAVVKIGTANKFPLLWGPFWIFLWGISASDRYISLGNLVGSLCRFSVSRKKWAPKDFARPWVKLHGF